MPDLHELVERYVAVWNEADPARRRAGIESLWAPDGAHFTQSLEARGYEAIETRVSKAHHQWVEAAGFRFERAGSVDGHHDTVRFNWEMVPAGGGQAAALGFDFLILDGGGRIRFDYQYNDAVPST